jgi:TRAP-type C4-dicarboxylate transport system substrate-binding protein
MTIALSALVAAGTLLWQESAQAEVTLRAGSVLPKDTDQGQAAEFFAKRVNELTNGEVTVQVFHSGELGTPPTQYENLIAGAQDIVIDTIDYLTAYDDRIGIVNTPFVFRNREHFQAFLNSDVFAEIAKGIEERGMVFVGDYNWMRQQDRGILSRDPIKTPEDVQGYKLRMFQAEIPIQSWSLFGANVQVIAWSEIYTALVTGAVDGLTGVVSASYLSAHTEQLKYFTNLREYYQIVLPIVSARTWNKLTDEQKAAVEKATVEAGAVYVKLSKEKDIADTEKAKNAHGLQLVEAPIEAWQAKAEEVHRQIEEKGLLPAGLIAKAKAVQ